MLEFNDVSFSYTGNGLNNKVIKKISYSFEPGKMYAVVGPSGSGKTTFLTLAAGLDVPNEGSVNYGGSNIKKIGYEKYRRKHIGVVFQSYNLIKYMTALQNVVTALDITGLQGNRKEIALEFLKKLGLTEDEAKRNVLKLSGGQQQRVAIARALACNVDVLLADEPTGNLDSETTNSISELLSEIAKQYNKCVIAVTHSKEVASKADIVLKMKDGCLIS